MVGDLEALSRALTEGAAACDKAAGNELYSLIMADRARIEEELNRNGRAIIMFRGVPYKVTRTS